MHALSDASFDSTTLKQIMSGGWTTNGTIVRGHATAGVDADHRSGGRAAPVANFTSADIATLLALSNFLTSGLAVGSGSGAVLPFRTRSDGGTFAGSDDFASACAGGLLIPGQISIDQSSEGEEQPAITMELMFHAKSSTGLDPVANTNGNTLSASAFVAQFQQGPVLVNGTEVTEVTNVTVDPGITVEAKHYNGLPFPQRINIRRRNPTISITTENIAQFATSGGFGNSYSSTSSVAVYLRRKLDGGIFVADATATHGLIGLSGGLALVQTISGQDVSDGTGTIVLSGKTLTHSVTNAMPE